MFLVGEGTLSRASGAMRTIGKEAGPSIIAAGEIGTALADLDANAATYLLGPVEEQDAALRAFEARRAKIPPRLVSAVEHITYGDAEKVPLLALFENFGRYLELFAEARFRFGKRDMAGAIDSYRAATTVMHVRLLPAAESLDGANRSYLDDLYEEQRRANTGSEVVAVLVGALLLFALGWAQLFLVTKMRRMFNPALFGATALALVLTIYSADAFGTARDDLRAAKTDAFESIHILWRARTTAYDAKGDENRYLLDTTSTAASEALYTAKVNALTSAPDAAMTTLVDARKHTVKFTGLFADQLRNVTFPGEWEASTRMLDAYGRYRATHARAKRFESAGQHDLAVRLCIGGGANDAPALFAAFDRALGDTLEIKTRAFNTVIKEGDDALKRASMLEPVLTLLIAALTFLGLRPRLREYA